MRSAYDCSHVKGVRAMALLWEKQFAGKVVANYSDNPAGSVCTATVSIFRGPIYQEISKRESTEKSFSQKNTGTAGGYGYDKLSQAVWNALKAMKIEPKKVSPGNGLTVQEFEAWGYEVIEVL